MPVLNAEKARKIVDRLDEKIAAVEERKQAAIEKVEARFAEQLTALQAEREHAASHPALQDQLPPPVGEDTDTDTDTGDVSVALEAGHTPAT